MLFVAGIFAGWTIAIGFDMAVVLANSLLR
jgi:hypothetical protein